MRSIALAARLPLFAVVLSAVALHAQFKDPTKEELQMTAEPKAPGAHFVYLDYEQLSDDETHTNTFYFRIKVLTEEGRERATVSLPYTPEYQKMPEITGRTIHPDGVVVPMTEKAVKLTSVKTRDYESNKIVFTLPDVTVGSILEYRLRETWKDFLAAPTWYIEREAYALHEHFDYHPNPMASVSYSSFLPPSASVIKGHSNHYTLDLSGVRTLPDEEWRPPLNIFAYRVSFFFTNYKSQDDFWKTAGERWADALKDATKPTGKLKEAASSLVAPADSETVKARKIYAAVMAMENTDFTRTMSEVERKKLKIKLADSVEDLWSQKRASGDALTLLFVALCRAAGLNVEPVHVVDREWALFSPVVLNSQQFDDYIAVAHLDGKEVFLDPGDKMCPFGQLFWGHTITTGMRYADKGATLFQLPAPDYRQTTIMRLADLTADDTGAVKGTVRFILSGQEALRWRHVALRNDENETRKQFNEWVADVLPKGVEGEFDHFLGLDKYESQLVAIVHVSGPAGTATSKRVFLPALFFESNGKHPFASAETRITPVDLHYPFTTREETVYHLPEGFALESAPQTAGIPWQGHALMKITVQPGKGAVTVDRDFIMGLAILAPADYSALHDFYQRMATVDQQQIVLTRAPVAKGQ